MNKLYLIVITSAFVLASCGGGGGGGSTSTPPTTPAPTVNLSAEPTSVLLESTSTLTWSSTNATSCSASWTSQTGTSGSEAITISTVGNNSFSISCTGAGGTRSASVTVEGYRETDGVVVDGYISGAEVCIDEDESWTCDASENSTTSDNEGKFTIRYANGNLVSIGGTDLDSQTLLDNLLITHKLTGHSDFKAVTPVTSVAAFMEDASLVNAALGIDSSIDVFTFDPVANKGDGGINDYLYEKGNQLTVLAFALQNITNNLNNTTETTQDYFKAITEEIEKEYTETETKVDIETEAFVTKALENVIEAKSVTIDETAKTNTTKALAGVLPVIEVKSSSDLTTSVIRFAVSTLQTDIQAIANGTATAETVSSYTSDILNYIANDQDIDSISIAPSITAITDSISTSEDTSISINVLSNDSYVTSAPITITDVSNGDNGITSLSDNHITYIPADDYNGSDTFSYTIEQANNTSTANVNVNIEAVNDAPSIVTSSSLTVAEGTIEVATIEVLDIDNNDTDLTLTHSGKDAESFSLSSERLLSFVNAPVYAEKSQYEITLELSDGNLSSTKVVNIKIQKPNSPPKISANVVSEDENIISLSKLTLSDDEANKLSVSIKPNWNPESANYAPIGTQDDLDGKETVVLGNEDGSIYTITSDLIYEGNTIVKLISDIQIADGVQLFLNNSGGIFSAGIKDIVGAPTFPKIEVGGGKFRCLGSLIRRIEIRFGYTVNAGEINLSGCSWIGGALASPDASLDKGRYYLQGNYLEKINTRGGEQMEIIQPNEITFIGNIFYNTGQLSMSFRAADMQQRPKLWGNTFVSNNSIPNAYPYGGCPKAYVCVWESQYISLDSTRNAFLNTNIPSMAVTEYFGLGGGSDAGIVSYEDYFGITDIEPDKDQARASGKVSITYPLSSLPPSGTQFQPRLFYDGDYTFSFDIAPDFEAGHRDYYYEITFDDGEFTVTEPVKIQINDVSD